MTHKLNNGYFDGAIAHICDIQTHQGAIAWFENGVIDPWNHLEAVMGLNLCGAQAQADKGFRFLQDTQLPDGSWWGQLGSAVPIDETLQNFSTDSMATGQKIRETNFTAYIATAIWHDYLLHSDIERTRSHWPMVEAALDFVIRHQTIFGDIIWLAGNTLDNPHGFDSEKMAKTDSLLTGNSSIYKSLVCGLKLAEILSIDKPAWETARQKLQTALTKNPERFNRNMDATQFSMDWYYPALSGALPLAQARDRIDAFWDIFVVEGLGCKCVAHETWVTMAETAELAITLKAIGLDEKASQVLSWLDQHRDENGAYWIGYEYEAQVFWPIEKPPWTAGAVILATDAIEALSPAHRLFL